MTPVFSTLAMGWDVFDLPGYFSHGVHSWLFLFLFLQIQY